MRKLCLVQLPVPPPAALAATGNVPLAAGCLGVAARVHGLRDRLQVEVLDPSVTDSLGDTLLADRIARSEPDFVGFSLYLWNSERSLHLAREVKRRSPRTRVLIGGPEVCADNSFLLGQGGADVAVSGEAVVRSLRPGAVPFRLPYGIQRVASAFPLGAIGEQMDPRVAVIASLGIAHQHWTSDFEDWTLRAGDGPALAARMIAHVAQCEEAGIDAVLDLHDSGTGSSFGYDRPATVEGVKLLLEEAGRRGWKAFTVPRP